MSLNLDKPLIVFDVETTGLADPIRIIQIATIKYLPDGEVEEKIRLINPERPIEPEAIALHGITDEMVAVEKPFLIYARSMATYFAGCDLCGFNSRRYDFRVLREEFNRANISPDFSGVRHIDVMSIYHHFFPRDLSAAHREYCGAEMEGAHDAMGDAKATAAILLAQIERHELPNDVGALSEFMGRVAPARDRSAFAGRLREDNGQMAIAFGKHSGRALTWMAENERGYLEWILGADFEEEIKAEIRKVL
jgi:DNA polymerase-3 subunit epsilon